MLRVYSQERRRERYMIIFLWKISQGLVSGYSVQFAYSRNGRTIVPMDYVRGAPSVVRNAREKSLGVKRAQLFNLLPQNLRSMNSDRLGKNSPDQ